MTIFIIVFHVVGMGAYKHNTDAWQTHFSSVSFPQASSPNVKSEKRSNGIADLEMYFSAQMEFTRHFISV